MGYGAVFCVKMGQARWPWNVMVREKSVVEGGGGDCDGMPPVGALNVRPLPCGV